MKSLIPALFLASMPALAADPLDLSGQAFVDLSHAYGENTLFWPTSPIKFEHKQLAYGETEAGYFYSAYSFCMPEHGGTHLDAPIHFSKGGDTADKVPLDKLIGPAVVIDISKQAAANRNYRLQAEDVDAFEKEHGRIPDGSAVLLRTGWDRYWPDAKSYLGDDTPGDASRLSFPSFGAAAVAMLISERHVRLIGIDTASIDYGPSREFPVHQLAGGANIPALENLTGLGALPATGTTLIALPMKIEDGSGGPVRVVALVPKAQ
ncbi:MAG: cyclase family protein [Alphaproteobacteria bacterium]|nr:MAG: cyclase family protein [Alphaproteobacteria bacterium]